jgi:thioredoxin-related protein
VTKSIPHLLMLCAFSVLMNINSQAAQAAEPLHSTQAVKAGKVLGGVDTEYPAWFNDGFLDFREDLVAANAAGKRLMIMFVLNGCPYCHAMVERNLAQKEIEELVRGKFEVIALNMMGDRSLTDVDGKAYNEKSYAEAMKVQFTPTILFLNEQGEVILRLNGYLPPEQFKIALNYLVEKSGQLSYRDYLELNAKPAKPGKLNAQPFFVAQPFNLTRNAATKKKPLAVFFEQSDCPNCDTLHQKVLSHTDTRQLLQNLESVQLDMWSDTPVTTPQGKVTTARNWARQLDVKYAPTIILFGEDGKEIVRTEAFVALFHLQTVFDFVNSGVYKQQPSFQRYIGQRSERIRAQGQDVDIWSMEDGTPAAKK